MAIGGPVSFAGGFLRGFSGGRGHGRSRERDNLAEMLRLQKEAREFSNQMRENQEAVAKEGLAMQKAQSEVDNAQRELDLIEHRRAQILADPGRPYNSAVVDRQIYDARKDLEDARAKVSDHQVALMNITAKRGGRIESDLANKGLKPGTGEYGKAYIKAGEDTRDNPDDPKNIDYKKFEGARDEELTGLEKDQEISRRSERNIGGFEAQKEEGKSEKSQINEEARNKELFPLDKQSSELRAKKLDANAAVVAAAQEMAARRSQAQEMQSQQGQIQAAPGYQRAVQGGGAGAGKGGGGGLLGGLGAAMGKGGGVGPAAGGGRPGLALPQGQARVPTVGQAVAPILGRVADMPLPQAVNFAKQGLATVLGNRTPQPPQRPVFTAPPSVAMQGRGGSPAVQQFVKGGAPDMAPYRDSIAAIESRGSGDYGAINRLTGATGRYQVMPQNIGPWTQEALGYPMTQQQFLANPQAQDKVFDHVFGGYLQQGSPSDAASKWFTGKPLVQGGNRQDVSGTSGNKYVGMFNRNLGQDRIGTPPAPQPRQPQPQAPSSPSSMAQGPQPEGQKKGAAKPQQPAPPKLVETPPADISQQQQALEEIRTAPPVGPQPSGPYPVSDPSTGKQGYGAAPSSGTAPQVGPPKITSPDQLKGMKPGSLWISPDGKLRIVPLEQAGQ